MRRIWVACVLAALLPLAMAVRPVSRRLTTGPPLSQQPAPSLQGQVVASLPNCPRAGQPLLDWPITEVEQPPQKAPFCSMEAAFKDVQFLVDNFTISRGHRTLCAATPSPVWAGPAAPFDLATCPTLARRYTVDTCFAHGEMTVIRNLGPRKSEAAEYLPTITLNNATLVDLEHWATSCQAVTSKSDVQSYVANIVSSATLLDACNTTTYVVPAYTTGDATNDCKIKVEVNATGLDCGWNAPAAPATASYTFNVPVGLQLSGEDTTVTLWCARPDAFPTITSWEDECGEFLDTTAAGCVDAKNVTVPRVILPKVNASLGCGLYSPPVIAGPTGPEIETWPPVDGPAGPVITNATTGTAFTYTWAASVACETAVRTFTVVVNGTSRAPCRPVPINDIDWWNNTICESKCGEAVVGAEKLGLQAVLAAEDIDPCSCLNNNNTDSPICTKAALWLTSLAADIEGTGGNTDSSYLQDQWLALPPSCAFLNVSLPAKPKAVLDALVDVFPPSMQDAPIDFEVKQCTTINTCVGDLIDWLKFAKQCVCCEPVGTAKVPGVRSTRRAGVTMSATLAKAMANPHIIQLV